MNNNQKFQTGNIFLISVAHFVHDVYSSFLVPILPLLIEKLSMSYTQAGFLTVIQRLPSLLNALVGLLADKISVKFMVIFSPAVTVTVMSLLGIAPNYIMLSAILLIMGVSSSMFHVPAPVMIRQIAGNSVGKGMSLFMLGGELARSVGPIVVLGGVSLWGLEGIYKLIPFGWAASFILYIKFRKINITQTPESKKAKAIFNILRKYSSLFAIIFGITFFTSILKGTITTFLTVYLTNQGESLWYAGASLSIFQLAGAAGTLYSGTFSDKIGRKKVLLISAVFNPILLLLFVHSGGVVLFILLVMLGFLVFSFTPVLMTLVNTLKSDFPTFLNGVYMTISFLTSALTIPLIGVFADYFTLETTYIISALLGIFAIPFVLKIKS
jgi:FSR family fosmidomycin resistance protein-like MFS transporter